MHRYYAEQAEQCRDQARRFAGRPEEKLLLSVAKVFDDLAKGGTKHVRSLFDGQTAR